MKLKTLALIGLILLFVGALAVPLLTNSPASNGVSTLEEVWTLNFVRAGGSDGAVELHYLDAKGVEISSETLTVGATGKGLLGLPSVACPDNVRGIIGYCRTASIKIGTSGARTNAASANYTTASPTTHLTLAVGQPFIWGQVPPKLAQEVTDTYNQGPNAGVPAREVGLTPTLDTSVYASGDVLFDTAALAGVSGAADQKTWLAEVEVTDEDDQPASDQELYFFSANSSLGTINAAPTITDANTRTYIGRVVIPASAWIDVGGAKIAKLSISDADMPKLITPATGTTTVYVACIVRGTPTYTGNNLRYRFFFKDEK